MEIGVFVTTLKSGDNIRITVPNSQIYGATIHNYNGYDTRRIDLVMGISYDDDIQTAVDTIRSIVTADDRVLADPELQIAVSNLGDSSVDLVVRPWCAAADYWTLRFDLTRRLKEGLEGAGCSIPYPQTDVHLQQVAS
jgi:small conductance mechanosensitive channel